MEGLNLFNEDEGISSDFKMNNQNLANCEIRELSKSFAFRYGTPNDDDAPMKIY